jgi:hypothetical protein
VTIEEIEQSLKTVADASASHEARMTNLENSFKESFQRVALAIEHLTRLATVTDERLDAGDEARIHTDTRLDALIDAQIGFDERLAQFATVQAEHRKEAEERGARLDEKLAQLAAAQARTDDQIRQLLGRNGPTDDKPKGGGAK